MNPVPWSIAEVLPHTGRMILLDRIIDVRDNGLSAELCVRGDSILPGVELSIPAWAGIEYMAQAIGAYVGILAKQAGQPIRLGFLLGARRYTSNVNAFEIGATLTVHIEKILQDPQFGVFECEIRGENIEIIATLNVYQPKQPDLHHTA